MMEEDRDEINSDWERLRHLDILIANGDEDFEEYQEAVYLRNKLGPDKPWN